MKLVLATSLWARLTGLLKKERCAHNEVLLLAPCRSIHSFGMREAMDVAFLDSTARVLAAECALPPARLRSHPQAVAVLERRHNSSCYWPTAGEQMCINASSVTLQERGAL